MRRFCFVLLAVCLAPVPVQTQNAYSTGREIQKLFPELVGSDASVRAQNRRADEEGIGRVCDPGDPLNRRLKLVCSPEDVRPDELVPVPVSEDLVLRKVLAAERAAHRKSFRDWVVELIVEMARFHRETVGQPLQLNDGTRTAGEQAWLTQLVPQLVQGKRLLLPRNPNAAPVIGEKASLHIRGISADFLATGNLREEVPFAEHLIIQERLGCLDATRELFQPVYHVVFFPRCLVSPHTAAGAGSD